MSSGRLQFVWWGWRRLFVWPPLRRWRYGPQSKPEWWLFDGYITGPLEVRVWRKNPPWVGKARMSEQPEPDTTGENCESRP